MYSLPFHETSQQIGPSKHLALSHSPFTNIDAMTTRLLHRHITCLPIAFASALFLTACPEPTEPPPTVEPSFEVCDPIQTERECFEAGCSYFANGAFIDGFGQEMCTRGASFGVCLFSEDPDGPDTLTTYTRQIDDGSTQSIQLNFDVSLEGWTRCGTAAIPPDCDCDGQ